MAYFRAGTLAIAVLFFLALTPLQWLALRIRSPFRFWFPRAFGRTFARLLRLDVRAHYQSRTRGLRILAANHLSWLDILAFWSVSHFALLTETVFVDRGQRHSFPSTNAAIARRLAAGRSILIFPEATTGDGLALRKFHSSHFAAADAWLGLDEASETVFVQPAAIRYSTPAAAWHGEAGLFTHLWLVLKAATSIRCDLIFGEPLTYRRGDDRKTMAREATRAINSLLAAPRSRIVIKTQSGISVKNGTHFFASRSRESETPKPDRLTADLKS
ncbi:MAG TPA: lysophospholipid acyltransferase family protein [Methylocella sp.]|nr:lysophospholipid acyltransferase family protein [Methylocella sp.]